MGEITDYFRAKFDSSNYTPVVNIWKYSVGDKRTVEFCSIEGAGSCLSYSLIRLYGNVHDNLMASRDIPALGKLIAVIGLASFCLVSIALAVAEFFVRSLSYILATALMACGYKATLFERAVVGWFCPFGTMAKSLVFACMILFGCESIDQFEKEKKLSEEAK